MLDFVEFEQVYGPPHIVGSPPFANMRLKAQPGRLGFALDGLKHLYRLRAFIAGEVKRLEHPELKKGSRPSFDSGGAAMSGDAELRNPVDVWCASLMSHLQGFPDSLRRAVIERDAPDIFADFQARDAILARLNEGRL